MYSSIGKGRRAALGTLTTIAAVAVLRGCSPGAASDADDRSTVTGEPDTAMTDTMEVNTASAQLPQPESALLTGRADADSGGDEYPGQWVYGLWRVVDVTAEAGVSAGFAPDRSLIGKTIRFDESVLSWQDEDGRMEAAERCPDPMYQSAWTAAIARNLAKPFRPAWAALKIPLKDVGSVHYWKCDTADGASFGPEDAIFFPIGEDRMLMNSYDGTIMLLRRS